MKTKYNKLSQRQSNERPCQYICHNIVIILKKLKTCKLGGTLRLVDSVINCDNLKLAEYNLSRVLFRPLKKNPGLSSARALIFASALTFFLKYFFIKKYMTKKSRNIFYVA